MLHTSGFFKSYLKLKFNLRYIDDHKDEFIKNLSDVVAIKSVSAQPENRNDIITMIKWMKAVIKNILTI